MDEKTKVLVERLINAATMHRKHPCEVYDMVALANEAAATICAQAEEIGRIRQKAVVVMEMYEAELARIKSAEGCDVEGALDAYMDAPNKGLPYDSLVQQRMSAALAVGCAPLRAKVEKMEAVVKAACEYEAYPSERALDELETRVIEYTRHAAPKEPANG